MKALVADDRLIPTGQTRASDLPNPVPMAGHQLDNGFTDLQRDAQGKAHFRIKAGSAEVNVIFGPKYPVAVLWEPVIRGVKPDFICIEPMTSITDGLNLHHRGLYDLLQTVAPGERWTESFWIRPEGI
jgi:aldose 1-epimerase